MRKDFKENVEELYQSKVTVQDADRHSVADLQEAQDRKKRWPLNTIVLENSVKMIFYQISVDVKNDLSEMTVSYNSNFTVTLHDLSHCDVDQLAEFLLALERKVPHWKHIWDTDNKVQKLKSQINGLIQTTLKGIRQQWTYTIVHVTDEMKNRFRMKFYNLKAMELMLEHENPYWVRKQTEKEILKELKENQIVPPLEQWEAEWTAIREECEKSRAERERYLEEQKKQRIKNQHLIKIKELKIRSLLQTIDYHPWVSTSVSKQFSRYALSTTFNSSFYIHLLMDKADITILVKYQQVDALLEKILSVIKKVNERMPQLQEAMAEDGKGKKLSLTGSTFYDRNEGERWTAELRIGKPMTVKSYVMQRLIEDKKLRSCQIAKEIQDTLNGLLDEIRLSA